MLGVCHALQEPELAVARALGQAVHDLLELAVAVAPPANPRGSGSPTLLHGPDEAVLGHSLLRFCRQLIAGNGVFPGGGRRQKSAYPGITGTRKPEDAYAMYSLTQADGKKSPRAPLW